MTRDPARPGAPPSPAHPARSRTRRPTTLLLAAVVATLIALLAAPSAAAHDVLEGSDPADGASLATSPPRITLTFDGTPSPEGATVTVVGPDGARYEQGAATVQDGAVSVGVNPLGAAGVYEVGYRVVSGDGHPISGTVSFTLTAPGPAAAAPASPASPAGPASGTAAPVAADPATTASSSGEEGGLPAWPFVALAVVVIAGAVALVLRRRA